MSEIAKDIDHEYKMKKLFMCPKCFFYDKKKKQCTEERCQNMRRW